MTAALEQRADVDLPDDLALRVGRFVAGGDVEDMAFTLRLLERRAVARVDERWDDVEIIEHTLHLGCMEHRSPGSTSGAELMPRGCDDA